MAVGVSVEAARSRPTSGRGARVTDAYRYARGVLFIFLASAVDIFNVLDRGGSRRYLILLIPIMVVALIRARRRSLYVRRRNTTDKIIFAIWLMGMLGTLYGVFQIGGNATARPLFFPMTLAFLYLLVLDSPTDDESAKVLRAMTYVGAIYLGLAAVVNVGILPGLAAFKQFRNAQVAYVMVGIGGAYLLRRWWLFGTLLLFEAINFAAYPSATSILCTVAMLVTFFITKPDGSRARPYVIGILSLFVVMIALAQLSEVSRITGDYFVAVGKVNANDGRLAIWGEGISTWQASPFVGEMFTGGTVAQTFRTRNGQILQLPFHNDYVLFLAQGGALGLGLLIAFILSLNVTLVRAYRRFVAQLRMERAALVRLFLVCFNSFFVAAAFNPVLEGLSRSAVIFSMYGLAMLVCRDRSATNLTPLAARRSASIHG